MRNEIQDSIEEVEDMETKYEELKKYTEIQDLQFKSLKKEFQENKFIEMCLNCGGRHNLERCYEFNCMICKRRCDGYSCREIDNIRKNYFEEYYKRVKKEDRKDLEIFLFCINYIKKKNPNLSKLCLNCGEEGYHVY